MGRPYTLYSLCGGIKWSALTALSEALELKRALALFQKSPLLSGAGRLDDNELFE